MKQTTIAKDVSVLLQKTILVYLICVGEIKVFRCLWKQSIVLSFYKFPASGNNLSEHKKDDSAARCFLVKLARCGYFVFSSSTSLRLYSFQFLH